MKLLPVMLVAIGLLVLQTGCSQPLAKQEKKVGDGCEGCELMMEGMPSTLSWRTTIALGDGPGETIIISGTIYKRDGKTPAPDVILYVYQTNAAGLYSPGKEQKVALRHGHLRGWIKTNSQGQYEFKSIRPGSYPNSRNPQHIHPIIKEPNKSFYWIDEYHFSDDPLLTNEQKKYHQNRGGSGVITLKKNSSGVWIGQRDIILGLNIPNY